jgi:hypothetical protein
VQPIELLVVVERVVVEEEEALRLGEPSEGEHIAEAGVTPADALRVLVVRVLAVVDEERGAVCQVEAGQRLPLANAERRAEASSSGLGGAGRFAARAASPGDVRDASLP